LREQTEDNGFCYILMLSDFLCPCFSFYLLLFATQDSETQRSKKVRLVKGVNPHHHNSFIS